MERTWHRFRICCSVCELPSRIWGIVSLMRHSHRPPTEAGNAGSPLAPASFAAEIAHDRGSWGQIPPPQTFIFELVMQEQG